MFPVAFSALPLFGQVLEDFTDNELTQNPIWVGHSEHFTAESGMLQLRAPADGSPSYLSTANVLVSNASWECDLTLSFNPSSSNFCRVFLIADSADLNSSLNGYFVQIGSADDDICLYKQSGASRIKLVDGDDGLLNNESNQVSVRVTRSAAGEWELFVQTDRSEHRLEGIASDAEFAVASYAGLQCTYTSSRADKFAFSYFAVQALADEKPPLLVQADVKNRRELTITFSEPVNKSAMENPLNYAMGTSHPASIRQEESNAAVATLSFPTDFEPWKDYQLVVRNIPDLAGNLLLQDTISFIYESRVTSLLRDVVITEIMADPAPAVGLPEIEYVEVFNTTRHSVDLSHWVLSDGRSVGHLAEKAILASGEYAILTSASTAIAFSHFGKVLPVSDLPSLNNAGDHVILKNENGRTIDSIYFDTSWYQGSDKAEGGWSIEILDPLSPCGGTRNWNVSEQESGGTPGVINSINEIRPDLTGPMLVLAKAILPDTVALVFNETLAPHVPSKNNFAFSPSREIAGISINKPRNTIHLKISTALLSGEPLAIVVDDIKDCAGNVVQQDFREATVVVPEPADSLDVVINEILFNPVSNGADFVEVFNRSHKFLDLSGWRIGNLEGNEVINDESIALEMLILPPQEYAAFTVNPPQLLSDYPLAKEERIFKCKTPPVSDEMGSVGLVNAEGKIIDAMRYTDEMHSIFVRDPEGVSLERISFTGPSQGVDNWTSAASHVGFATPGYENSNIRSEIAAEDDIVVVPEIFAPLSAEQAFTTIEYDFAQGGFVGTICILDAQGRRIKSVVENGLFGTSGFFRWDGDRDDGSKAAVGNYMVRIELFNSNGVVKVIRKRVAVASQF